LNYGVLTTIKLRDGLCDLNCNDLSPAIVGAVRIMGPKIPNIFTGCIRVCQDIQDIQELLTAFVCYLYNWGANKDIEVTEPPMHTDKH